MEGIGVFESAEPCSLSILRSTMCTLWRSTVPVTSFPSDDYRVQEHWAQVGEPMEEKLQHHFNNRDLLFLLSTLKSHDEATNMK